MKKLILILLIILTSAQAEAQFFKDKSIDANIGYGVIVPYDDIDSAGSGFYLQGEYVLTISNWIDLRPYVGLILSKANDEDFNGNPTPYFVTSNALLFGGKARVTIPIPWVAPYFELGIGGSLGKFETFTPDTIINKSGLIYHIPVSIGLQLGPKHNIDLALTYCTQETVRQAVGAFAIGFTFPLN